VLADGVVVGRIMKAEAAPVGDPMDVDAGFRPSRRPHAHSRNEATRQAAMQAFARSWHRET
jgi:hypothetical protein